MGATKNKGYRSEIAGAVPEMMSDSHDTGVVPRVTADVRRGVPRSGAYARER